MRLPVPPPKDGWENIFIGKFPPWVQTNLEVMWAAILLIAVLVIALIFAVGLLFLMI